MTWWLNVCRLALLLFSIGAMDASAAPAALPPNELLQELFTDASAVVRVASARATISSKEGIYTQYVVTARVLKAYKGRQRHGEVVRYAVLVESGLENFSSAERIAFLKPAETQSPGFRWNALEAGEFPFSAQLDEWIQKQH
jgi:hypothetical protein